MPLNSKLVIPVALGLSIVSITAFMVYYVFKKDEEEESAPNKKPIKPGRTNVIEIKVPKNIVPALIGRNGSNIKDIEQKSGALIHFKRLTEEVYDVCIIRGRIDASQLAETLIHDFINQQPLIIEDAVDVPGWACGRIIGVGGENINDMSHRSGARIKVEGSPAIDKQTQRRITFRGTQAQIDIAMRLVEECVAQEKCRREIELSRRSPRYVPTEHPLRAPIEPPGDSVRHVQYKRSDGSNGSIEVYVSAVSSPARFWVQFTGPQNTQLDELVAHMTEYYNDRNNREMHALDHASIGQVVAAVFRHDGRWYRARVHNILPNEYDASKLVADVFFVDYGDSEFVSVTELCELRADLLRLRFQAMECFLAGVKPVGTSGVVDNPLNYVWSQDATERFEDLTQVARWKPLVSKTCTYNKTATIEGEKLEIPGIQLYDITDEGELDIGHVLVEEGYAVPCDLAPPTPREPFGDLGASRVLGMGNSNVSSSLQSEEVGSGEHSSTSAYQREVEAREPIPTSASQGSGLEKTSVKSISNFDLSYADNKPKQVNGSHENFLNAERSHVDQGTEGSTETLTPHTNRDNLKANMNRIDSHHSNLELLERSPTELHK
ncbi:hypothetical protein ACJJTC_002538 [Scirpophaga incertulas]